MKRKGIVIATILIFICFFAVLVLSKVFFTGGIINGSISKIELQKSDNSNIGSFKTVKEFTENRVIGRIKEIINKSSKIEGILNVASPEYRLVFFQNEKLLYTLNVWIYGDEKGMCMLKNDTEKGYSIEKLDRIELSKILLDK